MKWTYDAHKRCTSEHPNKREKHQLTQIKPEKDRSICPQRHLQRNAELV